MGDAKIDVGGRCEFLGNRPSVSKMGSLPGVAHRLFAIVGANGR